MLRCASVGNRHAAWIPHAADITPHKRARVRRSTLTRSRRLGLWPRRGPSPTVWAVDPPWSFSVYRSRCGSFAAPTRLGHLEGSDQPFETQLQTAWVSFGEQMRVTYASAEGGSAKLVDGRSRSAIARAGWPGLWRPIRAKLPALTMAQPCRDHQRTVWLLPPGR